MGEMSFDGGSDEGKNIAALLPTTLNHRQHRLDKSTATYALSSKRQHSAGLSGFTSSQSSAGINGRSCFAWPGCPPRLFLDLRFFVCGRACGCCELGGSEEFCGFRPNRDSSFAIRVFNSAISTNNRRMMAWASGGWRAMIFPRNFKRHATGVAENAPRVQVNL